MLEYDKERKKIRKKRKVKEVVTIMQRKIKQRSNSENLQKIGRIIRRVL